VPGAFSLLGPALQATQVGGSRLSLRAHQGTLTAGWASRYVVKTSKANKGALTPQITRQSTIFDNDQQNRAVSFQAEIAERASEFLDRLNTLNNQAFVNRESWDKEAAAVTGAMQAKLDELTGLLNAISKRSLTADFGVRARGQARAAWAWSMLTVLAFIGSASWLIWFVTQHADAPEVSWATVIYKLGVTIAGLGLAAYSATQAAEHRQAEREAKRIQIVLATMEPYLEQLDPEQSKDLRLQIAKQVFLADTDAVRPPRRWGFKKNDINDILDVAERLRDLLPGKPGL